MGIGNKRNELCKCSSGKKYKNCCMNKITLTNDALFDHLKIQVQLLKNSMELYDRGQVIEALRLATTIRVLFHDTDKSTSLLKLISSKNILFYDTAPDFNEESYFLNFCGLALQQVKFNPDTGYKNVWIHRSSLPPAPFSTITKIPFDLWWNKIVIVDTNKNCFTRKDLILDVVNTDGGAHIDPNPSEDYIKLTKKNSMGWREPSKDGLLSFDMKEGPHLSSIRQISHEVLLTLKDGFPNLFE